MSLRRRRRGADRRGVRATHVEGLGNPVKRTDSSEAATEEPTGSITFPKAVDFSPTNVPDLGAFLRLVDANGGERSRLEEAVWSRFFSEHAASRKDPADRLEQQQELAKNVLRGMGPNGYGLVDFKSGTLTSLGVELLSLDSEEERIRGLARHALLNLHGLTTLESIRSLHLRRQAVTKASLHAELERRGFSLPRDTTYHMRMVQWFRKAGLVSDPPDYAVNEQAVAEVAGLDLAELREWSELTGTQKAFLRSLRKLAQVHGTNPISARVVRNHAEEEHGHIFPSGSQAARVTTPLERGGWIDKAYKKPGRGGKSGDIRATRKLLELDIDAISQFESLGALPHELLVLLDTPLEKIREDLNDSDSHVKGIALELLAIRLAVDLTLQPARFRERSAKTGGAEVDLIADGVHLHYSRWMFQCKNTASVNLGDLAKEIGLAVMLRAHVVVMVTTGTFRRSVREHAQQTMESGPLHIVLVDGRQLDAYFKSGPQAILDHFRNEAFDAMRLKREQALEGEDSD